ncbi:hypothetical protein GCM10022244_55810 [Streptomyces gulbargensis]|uniref:Uncharacterized protein n=1 Tax=Streptomyces gulbargensis TaxID=364901 RepID=A0ABP7N9K8_9ACTN
MEPATAMAATAARREVRVLATVVQRVERAVMVGFLRRVRELPKIAYAPSGVATSCDYGILPFGPAQTDGLGCQNRVTGDPRIPTGRYIKAGSSSETLPHRRKISGSSRHSDEWKAAIRLWSASFRTSSDVSLPVPVRVRSV